MKPDANHSFELEVLNGVRYDCKRWRKLASKCALTDDLVTPSTETQYKAVHHRILTICRDFAAQEKVSEPRRRLARQLDELLRPWSSTKLFKSAPPHLVNNLLTSQATLEEKLRGETNGLPIQRFRKVALTACIAGVAGILIVLFLQSMSGGVFTPPFRFLEGLMASIAAYVGRTTFTEQIAIAVMCSWLFGTWLLSRIYSS